MKVGFNQIDVNGNDHAGTAPEVNEAGLAAAVQCGDSEISTVGVERQEVSNSEFLAAIFQNVPKGASAAVCAKPGDPNVGGWSAMPASRVDALVAGNNNYFNCSSFYPEADGSLKARNGSFAGYHALVLDDVGTKVQPERLGDVKPTWTLETSPGNFQVGFAFQHPVTDSGLVTRLQRAVVAAGLCDPGATGQARWVRLPFGVNGKQQHKDAKGRVFRCKLVQFEPTSRFTYDAIVTGLNLELAASKSAPTPAHGGNDDYQSPVNTMAESDDCSPPPDLESLASALRVLPADCDAKTWIFHRIAAMANTAREHPHFAEQLRLLAISWSSGELCGVPSVAWNAVGSRGWTGRQWCAYYWKKFYRDTKYTGRPITVSTIYWHAIDAGWSNTGRAA